MNKINEIMVFDIFDFVCKKCNLNDYSKIFRDNDHFNLKGSLKLIKPFTEMAKFE